MRGLPDPRALCPHSFCLCLDRALNHEPLQTGGPQEGWAGAPLPTSAGSPSGPRKRQDLTGHPLRPGLCIYLGPEEAERLGTRGPLHFGYKQARLQALETMGNVLKQRIDLLTAQLLGANAAETLEDPPSDLPPSHPSTRGADPPPSLGTPKPMVPACPQALVPEAGRGSPWGWADVRARLLLSPSCLPDGETQLWSAGWERRRSVSPGGRLAFLPPGKPHVPPAKTCTQAVLTAALSAAEGARSSPAPRFLLPEWGYVDDAAAVVTEKVV